MTTKLSDVAKKANVSIATVSRVLNEYPHVNEDTRALVLKAAEDLNYPIKKIQNSNNNRSIILMGTGAGSYSSNDENPLTSYEEFSRLILAGTERAIEDTGIVPRLQYARRFPNDHIREASSLVNDPSIDGVILLGGSVDRQLVKALKESSFPFVIIGAHFEDLEVDSVMADYTNGIDQIIDHLLLRGKKRIALINGFPDTRTSLEKFKAYRLSLAMRDIGFDPQLHIPGKSEFSVKEGFEQTEALLSSDQKIDAIIYHDDYRAMGGLRALRARGVQIPDEIAVVGFHDYEMAQYSAPQLSTVHVRMRVMGEVGAQRLCALIKSPQQHPWYITVPTYLVVRESS